MFLLVALILLFNFHFQQGYSVSLATGSSAPVDYSSEISAGICLSGTNCRSLSESKISNLLFISVENICKIQDVSNSHCDEYIIN